MSRLLLDTHAVIWLVEGQPLSSEAKDVLSAAVKRREEALVSPMTAWEIGMLSVRGRVRMPLAPLAWFERLLASPGIGLADLTARILIASSYLPGTAPRDPMDRILVATAREGDLVLLTRDNVLLDYADQGHVKALKC